MAQYELNLRDYWRILRRRKGIIILVSLLFGAFSWLLAEVQRPEPIYQAAASVKMERVTSMAGLLLEVIAVSPGDTLATQAAVIRSFPVLERAARSLHLVPAEVPSEQIQATPRYTKVIGGLQGQVTAEPEGSTNIIKITVTSRDPREAARIANAVAEAYRQENLETRNRQVRDAKRFIEEQLAAVGERLRASEEALKALKERRGFLTLGEETGAAASRMGALETELDKVRRAREETAAQLRAFRERSRAPRAPGERVFVDSADPGLAKLNTTLLDLQLERENLLVSLTPEHPQVKDVEAKIETLRDNLGRELEARVRALQERERDLQGKVRQAEAEYRRLPEVALQLARLEREVKLNEGLFSQLKTKHQEVQIKEREQIEEVSIVAPAAEGRLTNPPQRTAKGLVGVIIGLTLGLVLAFVLESLDTSMGTIEDVETVLGVPVLGLIPHVEATAEAEGSPGWERLREVEPFLMTLLNPKSPVAEAYRSLRTNVEFMGLERNLKTLCVTSSSQVEGKTTTAINLAVTMAEMGKKTLLVEADLRKPFLHHAFGIPREPGLAEVIIGNRRWADVIKTATDLMLGTLGVERVVSAPNIDKLHILTSGSPPPNPTEFLSSQRMTDLLAEVREQFDLVIFDTSPILPVTDAAIMASKVDGTLIVYRVGKIPRSALKRAKTLLDNVRGTVLGIVLTGLRAEISPDYEELEYYRYAYGQEGRRPSPAAALSASIGASLRGEEGSILGRLRGWTRRLGRRTLRRR